MRLVQQRFLQRFPGPGVGEGGICLAEGKGDDVQAGEVVHGTTELCAFIRNGHTVL